MEARPALQTPTICPACDRVPQRVARRVQGRELWRCPACGLRWWDFRGVDPGALYTGAYFRGEAAHGYDDYYALRPALEHTGRIRLRRIARLLGVTRGHLLELGCGPGFFLAVARAAGWETHGVELSADACRHACDVLGLSVTCAPAETTVVPPGSADLVVLWDVLEHLPDPAAALRTAAAALRPGGGLALTTGDVESVVARLSGERWHLYTFPEHLYFHTPRSVRTLLQRSGFEVRAIRREGMVVSAAYAVERVAKTLLGGRGRLRLPALSRLCVPVNLGDVLAVYAIRGDGG
ncbi:MAG: class I SAM-dependent methyltransferase [Candidatus Binatia bacterium]